MRYALFITYNYSLSHTERISHYLKLKIINYKVDQIAIFVFACQMFTCVQLNFQKPDDTLV